MSSFARFAVDKTKETEGTWFDYGDFKLKLRRAGPSNKEYARAMDKLLFKPYGRAIQNKSLTDETSRPIMAKIFASTIVTDWGSIETGHEKQVNYEGDWHTFSSELMEEIFNSYPELLRNVINDAEKFENFTVASEDDDVKN